MRIVKIDRKANFFQVVPENLDDLWHLQKIIEPGDLVKGQSTRSWKPRDSTRTERKNILVEVRAEKIELHKHSSQLRINGEIVWGKPEEFVELKAFHSIEVEPEKIVSVKKQKLREYQIERLQKAKDAMGRQKIAVVVLDDEQASIALLKDFGLEEKAKILASKSGKQFKAEEDKKYFSEIGKILAEAKPEKAIIAGPGFTREHLLEYLKEKMPKLKASSEALNSVGETGLHELLKKGIAAKAASESQIEKEARAVEALLKEIGQDSGKAAYGLKEVINAVEQGAASELLVTEKELGEKKEEILGILEKAEQAGAKIHIFSSEFLPGKQLQGIGGIAAILRYALK